MCGDIAVETGAGDVQLIGVSGRLSARVGSGSIDVAGTPTAAWRLHSGAGDVMLRLPADTGFELDASTGIGAIATSHPLMGSGDLDNRAMRGVTRAGGPLISASTGVDLSGFGPKGGSSGPNLGAEKNYCRPSDEAVRRENYFSGVGEMWTRDAQVFSFSLLGSLHHQTAR